MGNKEQSENINEQATETASLSKEDEKTARKARLRERRLARRAKRNARIARGRHLKNFFIWFLGVLFLPTVIAAASFVIPISIITGKDGKYVSEELSNKSLFGIVKFVAGNSGDLGFADFPIVANALSDLQKTQIGERDDGEDNKTPITIGDIIYIDTDKLNTIKFSGDVAGNVSSCVEVIATIEKLGGASSLGDFGGLNVFTDEEQVKYFKKICTLSHVGAGDVLDNAVTEFEPANYFYKTKEVDDTAADNVYKRAFKDDKTLVDELSGLTPEQTAVVSVYTKALCTVADVGVGFDNNADSFEPKEYYYKTIEVDASAEDNVYKRAFKDDQTLVDELSGLSADKKAAVYLYYPPLEKVKLGELKDIIGDSIGRTTIKSLLETLGGGNETITSILGEDTTVKGIGSFDIDEVELHKVLKAPDTENPNRNKKLYDILRDATGVEGATIEEKNAKIKVGDLAELNTDNIYLNTVLPAPDDTADPESTEYKQNRKLYDILKDLTNNDNAKTINVGSLSGLDTDELHLNTVMGDVSGNRVLTVLKSKNITVGEIGTALNALSLYEVYGTDSFKAYDPAITTLNMNRSYYRIFAENGSAIYMLESNSLVVSAPDVNYYICYGTTGAMDYKTAGELGAVDTSSEYYKCTDKTTYHVSFEPALPAPDTSVYDYDDSVKYYHAASGDYVVSTYLDTVLYKITDENSNDFFLDRRDLLIKADADEYYACYDGETFVGYLADPTGYTYDDSVKYIKATDYSGNTVYVLDEKQYLDKDAGIWLLMSFDTAEYAGDVATRRYADQHGKAYKYTVDNMTIESLQKGSNFAKKFKNSTIKQLVDSGLIDDPGFTRPESYKYSLQELLEVMKNKGL